jgi:hypothetical protein
MGASLSGEFESQTIVLGKKNRITARIIRSKQGLAVAPP